MNPLRIWSAPLAAPALDKTLRVGALLIYLGAIFFFSSITGSNVPKVADDRIEHSCEYFGLGLVLFAAIAPYVRFHLRSKHGLMVVALAVAWGASDEFHQRFVPGRDSSLRDLAFDLLGATLAALFVLMACRRNAS